MSSLILAILVNVLVQVTMDEINIFPILYSWHVCVILIILFGGSFNSSSFLQRKISYIYIYIYIYHIYHIYIYISYIIIFYSHKKTLQGLQASQPNNNTKLIIKKNNS